MKIFLTSIIFMVILLNHLQSQSAFLDPQFGTGGLDTIKYSSDSRDEEPWEIVLLPDGKILVVGFSKVEGEDIPFPGIVRLKSNGELDEAFGTSGVSVIETEGLYPDLRGINVQPDGKILVSGFFNRRFGIYRTDNQGIIDLTFGNEGWSLPTICSYDAIEDLAVSKSGRIAGAGYSCEFNSRFTLALFKPDGSLDPDFNGTGVFTSEFNKAFRSFTAVEFQSDKKIVTAGYCNSNSDPSATMIYAVRVDSTGNPDSGFGNSGEFSYTAGRLEVLNDMAIQKDGKILLCFNRILRLNSNGTIDNSFGDNGIVETAGGYYNIDIQCIELQADGKIVAAGTIDYYIPGGGNNHIFITRYDQYGNLDNTFGNNGIIVTPIGSFDVITRSMVLQPDNKILVAGILYDSDLNKCSVLVARFLPDEAVGIEGMQPAQSGIIAYPNPVDDFIILENINEITEKLSWQLFDLTGKKIRNGVVDTDPYTIYTGNLNPSIYLLQISGNRNKLIKNIRIIKK
jgi:uncharacterized delta-60 repeat protein